MDLEAVAVVVAAVVGSTGVASLITGGIQLSRASRLKKAVTDMSVVVKLHEPGTAEFDAAQYALKVLTLDLVAARLVRVGARTWWKVFGLLVTVLTTVLALADSLGRVAQVMDSLSLRAILLYAGSYTLIIVGGFLFLFTRRRERLVANVLDGDAFIEDYVLRSSPPLQSRARREQYEAVEKKKQAKRKEARPRKSWLKGRQEIPVQDTPAEADPR
ncbi:hypothetical protein [Arthrobacter sp. R-11]|uniref:hypothetical protein n=1 Tax=Arthrobacter sp. R-11 TaxID=3404053 RepID=UPI003CF18178